MAFTRVGTVAAVHAASGNPTVSLSSVSSSIQAGDVIVAGATYRSASNPTGTPVLNRATGADVPMNTPLVSASAGNTTQNNATTSSCGYNASWYQVTAADVTAGFTSIDWPDAASAGWSATLSVYRPTSSSKVVELDGSSHNRITTAATSVTTAAITTTVANTLLVAFAFGARGSSITWSAFDAATDPTTGSNATTDTTNAPDSTWRERADGASTLGNDMSIAQADVLKASAGSTGTLSAICSATALNGLGVFAFREVDPPPAYTGPTYGTAGTQVGGGSSLNVSYPAGASNGRFAVLAIASGGIVANLPSGWLDLETADGSDASLRVCYKVLDGTESGSFTVDNEQALEARIFYFDGVDTANPFHSDGNATGTGGPTTPGNITSTSDQCLGVTITAYGSTATTPGSGWTERVETLVSDYYIALDTRDLATAGTVAASARGVITDWASVRFALKLDPATAAPSFVSAGTLTSTTGGTGLTCAYPASPQNNDIIFMAVTCGSSEFNDITVPTGFTAEARVDNGNPINSRLFWKRSDGTETGSVSFNAGRASWPILARMFLWRGCITTGKPYEDYSSATGTDASQDSNATSIYGPKRTAVRIYTLNDNGSVGSPPAGWTNRGDDSTATGDGQRLTVDSIETTGGAQTLASTARTNAGGSASHIVFDLALIPASTAAPAAYTLVAGAGAVTLTGVAAGLVKGNVITGAAGAVTLTGQAAGVVKTNVITAGAGVVTLTGQAAGVLKGSVIVAGPGAVTLTGQAAGLFKGQTLLAEAGVITLTGQPASILKTWVISGHEGFSQPAFHGQITLTGYDATITYTPAGGHTLVAEAGAITLTGFGANFLKGYTVVGEAGAINLTGAAAGIAKTNLLVAGPGAINLTGQVAGVLKGSVIVGGAGAITLTGQAAGLLKTNLLVAGPGVVTLTGQPASVLKGSVLVAGPGVITLTGQPAGVVKTGVITAAAGVITLTGQDAIIAKGNFYTLTAAAGVVTLTGVDAGVRKTNILVAGPGTINLTGIAATLAKSSIIVGGVGSITLTGMAAGIVKGNNYILTAEAGVIALTGKAAGLLKGNVITAAPGLINLTGVSADIFTGLLNKMSVKNDDIWKRPDPWVKDAGVWKTPLSVWIKEADVWKKVYG